MTKQVFSRFEYSIGVNQSESLVATIQTLFGDMPDAYHDQAVSLFLDVISLRPVLFEQFCQHAERLGYLIERRIGAEGADSVE
jgi:hypothetical protein